MNCQELIRVIKWQLGLLMIASLVAGVFGGVALLSCFLGGLCVALPNVALTLRLIFSLKIKRVLSPMGLILCEFGKLGGSCVLLVCVAKYFPELNWLALIFGISAATLSSLALMFNKH